MGHLHFDTHSDHQPMTIKPSKRDNDYFLGRLRAKNPGIYADLQSGKFRNATDAFIAAGLRKQRTALDTLLSAWSKATTAEQAAFRKKIGCITAPSTTVGHSLAPVTATTTHPGARSYLPKQMEVEVRRLMTQRNLRIGDVMRELGINPFNASLGMALQRGTSVSEAMISALTKWIDQNQPS